MAEPAGVWALHVWRSPDGNEHPQWSGPDDPRLCTCQARHTLADAPARLVCPGVAHTEGVRPCVLCGLGWRVPQVVRMMAPALSGTGVLSASATAPEELAPAPSCAYCAAGLEHYHMQPQTPEDQ